MKVIIVDDHPLVRSGLTSVLSLDGTFDVKGEAANCAEAMELLKSVRPDIALVDLRIADESGLDLIAEAMNRGVICMLTSSTEAEDFKLAKENGVDGYVLKEALPEELIQAMRIISKGRKYYDPGVIDFVMNSADSGRDVHGHIEQLTPKEEETLIALGKGLSNKEISQTLFITEYTVKKHVSQILAKLDLADRTQAALYANAKGLVKYAIAE
ncbi:response regulator [Virgibacillus doumboii]|uniref:response regulator n=1 Tax=Virgibacillus doumboii TaxID=2697503 RepID=UPI0013DFE864|nr:response regulator transcription factor [Virgibacillus doumboii]